jgi:hypothetical protein
MKEFEMPMVNFLAAAGGVVGWTGAVVGAAVAAGAQAASMVEAMMTRVITTIIVLKAFLDIVFFSYKVEYGILV